MNVRPFWGPYVAEYEEEENMFVEVEVVEGGQSIKTEKMKLKMIKEFSDGIVIYENEDGRAVLYSKRKNKYTLVSIDIA
jgi:hypothetical protein